MKPHFRRFAFAIISLLVTVGFVATPLTPLLSPAQGQDAQNTDIFTGQFIPAYLGAAYDPSEAFKQMAGLPVYVFAYDTWGKVVNNFAYKTQIRADGSFQAAGLANASHYGICLGVKSFDASTLFRAPLPEDGLQSVFAYAQQPYTGTNPNTQLKSGDEPVLAPLTSVDNAYIDSESGGSPSAPTDGQPCRIFLTSSKTVDIANHVNIFPLVPNSVLSVMISDQKWDASDPAPDEKNQPYEVYAKRITIQNGESVSTVVGPVIRGRTVPVIDGSGAVKTTIFQAYAPRGTYAITYWQPDDRSVTTAQTYINYDGATSLNSSRNGMAFESVSGTTEVQVLPGEDGGITHNNWLYRSHRDPVKSSWNAYRSTVNVWGVISYADKDGTHPINAEKDSIQNIVSLSSPYLHFVNVTNRYNPTCDTSSDASTNSSDLVAAKGIYYFSTACDRNAPRNDILSTISIRPIVESPSGKSLKGVDNQLIAARLSDGPGNQNFVLSTTPSSGVTTGILQDMGGLVLQDKQLDLLAGGRIYKKVAKTNTLGQFSIPNTYFSASGDNILYISTSSSSRLGGQEQQLAFKISPGTLNTSSVALNNLGTIVVGAEQTGLTKWLAKASWPNLLSAIHFPTVMAAATTYAHSGALDPKDIQLMFDSSALSRYDTVFTPANYSLDHLSMDAPKDISGGISKDNYEVFDAYDGIMCSGETCSYNGVIVDGSADYSSGVPNINGNIIGLRLKAKTKSIDNPYYKIFKDSKEESITFTLKASFKKNKDARATTSAGQVAGSGQEVVTDLPDAMEVVQPIVITRTFALNEDGNPTDGDWETKDNQEQSVLNDPNSGASSNYSFAYDDISLSITPPACGKNTGGWSLNPLEDMKKIWNTAIGFFEALPCRMVMASIGGVQHALEIIAEHFFRIDPLGFAESGSRNVVIDLWNILRNLFNSLAVFILVIAGIAIMLRYEPQTYSIRSVLTRLITAIVLINFSILILQVAIDIANVFSYGGFFFLSDAIEQALNLGNVPISTQGAVGAVGAFAAVAGYIFIIASATGGVGAMGIIGLILALFLVFGYFLLRVIIDYALRMAILIICIILAPAALAARALPGTMKYYTKWKNIVIGVLVAQVAFAFVLTLALILMKYAPTVDAGIAPSLILMTMAMALFYYSTKVPAKAAAMFGENIATGLESSLKKGATDLRGKTKQMLINRAKNKQLSKERENAIGLGKEARDKMVEEFDERMAKQKVNRLARSGLRFAMKAGLAGTAKGGVALQNYQRFSRGVDRAGLVGSLAGVAGEDMDHAEEEAMKQAQGEYTERIHAVAPHVEEAQHEAAWEETRYKGANDASTALAMSSLSKQRDNIAVLESGYDATFNYIDPQTGNEDTTGLGKLGNMTESWTTNAAGERVLQSSYRKGFEDTWGKVRKVSPKANDAVEYLATKLAGADISTKSGYNAFYSAFNYDSKAGKEAWIAFYNDAGMPVDPEVNARDLQGKVYEDLVIRPATKSGISGWGNSIRQANSQISGTVGTADRQRIPTAGVTAYDVPLGGMAHPTVGDNMQYVVGTAPAYIPARMARDVQEALTTVQQAYDYISSGAGVSLGSNSNPRSGDYSNAVKVLKRAGYTVS